MVKLAVAIDGRVTACTVAASSGSPALDEGTCGIARNIVFTPGHDVKGKPLPSTYTLPARWVLPADAPGGPGQFRPIDPTTMVIALKFGGNGALISCSSHASGKVLADDQLCRSFGARMAEDALRHLPEPMRGKPVEFMSETRQEYAGLPQPSASIADTADITILGRRGVRFTIEPTGAVSNCATMGAQDGLSLPPCDAAMPFRRLDGQPIGTPIEASWTMTEGVRLTR